MRIKRVEIIGFKSFCDRAVVNFDASITAVVGPNGCGKSNIVDAIRWCMGEQSAKHLRGKAMEDVIFGGSESRGPAAMAEVSLTFDDVGFSHETLELALNQQDELVPPVVASAEDPEAPAGEGEAEGEGDAEREVADPAVEAAAAAPTPVLGEDGQPIVSASADVRDFLADKPAALDFASYSEVTITRRLYRDGTSQYFINKTPCRLRDVTDFFLGTGVGTKAYSIIEQGRVGQIVSARPGDRRAIIEEAAGITKFKAKKKAAERKLDQTRQNLLRVSDIVVELDKRMGTLRRQAQKAERYRKYKAELRDIDLWKASHRLLELTAEDKLLRGRLTECQEDVDIVRVEYDTRDAAVIAERGELAIEERRLSELQARIYDLENRIKLSESKIDYQRREASGLDEQVQSATSEIDALTARRTDAIAQLETQRAELDALEDQVASEASQVATREAAATEARQMLSNAQSLLDESRQAISKARSDLARSEGQRDSLARRRDEAARRLARVLEETGTNNERSRELERESKKLEGGLAQLRQTRFDLGAQSESFAARKELLQESVRSVEAEVETLRTELHRRRSRHQSLLEIQEKYEGFARGTRAVMQKSDELEAAGVGRIRGLVADVVQAPPTLEIAVEAALGDRLGGILVDGHDVGLRAIQYLKNTGAGRSAFVPYARGGAASSPATPAAPAPEMSTLSDGADREGSTASWDPTWAGVSSGSGFEFEDRSALNAAAAAIGGEGVLGRMVDLVGFEADFAGMGKSLLADHVVVDTLDRAVALHAQGLAQTLVTLDGDIVDGSGVVSGGSREAQGAGVLGQKREIRDLEEIVASLEHDLADATARLVAMRAELTQVTKALEGLRTESHQGDIAITGHEKDLGRFRGEHDRLRERVTALNAEQLELEERMRGVEAEQLALQATQDDANRRIDEHEREQLGRIEAVSDGQVHVEELAAALTEARVRAAQLGQKQASLLASTLTLEKTEADIGRRIAHLSSSIENGVGRAATLREEAAAIEAELVGLRESRRSSAEEMESARNVYELRVVEIQVAEVTVRELRSRADKLGGEISTLKVRLETCGMNRRVLDESVMERYQLDLARVASDYHLRPLAGETEDKRLAELRDLIERMGADINLTAIEEFAEVSQRHEFLSTQRDDLESAVDQLARAIDKINKTSRKLFKDTFHAVNETFKQVFPRLFRGGQAFLSLSGGDDVDLLEAGVEIMAQPPGKKNATVEQLSGGEKALTAVALIFSIFLIKPSPFCILDEVDAPLDEANVDRYNEIVREMTDRSQFIVITHNKRTMEVADNLYGVTMQEPGVSKLVSVNLSKIDGRAAA